MFLKAPKGKQVYSEATCPKGGEDVEEDLTGSFGAGFNLGLMSCTPILSLARCASYLFSMQSQNSAWFCGLSLVQNHTLPFPEGIITAALNFHVRVQCCRVVWVVTQEAREAVALGLEFSSWLFQN